MSDANNSISFLQVTANNKLSVTFQTPMNLTTKFRGHIAVPFGDFVDKIHKIINVSDLCSHILYQ